MEPFSVVKCCIQKTKLEFYPKDRFNITQPVNIHAKVIVDLYQWLQRKYKFIDLLVVQKIAEFIPNCKCICHDNRQERKQNISFGNCDFVRVCDNPDHIFCPCKLEGVSFNSCTSVQLHDSFLYNDYQLKHMPKKWFIQGTNNVQKHFLLEATYQTTTAPHTRAISNYQPNSCHNNCDQNFCIGCKKLCCTFQKCNRCERYLHAECGVFAYSKSFCKACVRICMECKDYTIHYKKIIPRTLVRYYAPGEPGYDYSLEKYGYNYFFYKNSVLCKRCCWKNCAICEKSVLVTSLVYCQGCGLKICKDCGHFQISTNVSYCSVWDRNPEYCQHCVSKISCSVCNEKGNMSDFVKCDSCDSWTCVDLSKICTNMTKIKGPDMYSDNKFKCAVCCKTDDEEINDKESDGRDQKRQKK